MNKIVATLVGLLLAANCYAQKDLGDFYLGQTIRSCAWNTFDGDGDSATRSTDGTLRVYEDLGTTQLASPGITEDEDFDTDPLTGLHTMEIAATAANGYEAGKEYLVAIAGATVDGNVINAALCTFSIEAKGWLKGRIVARDTAGATNTASLVQLDTAGSITSADQYKGFRLWNVTQGWEAAITGSANAAPDTLTIYQAGAVVAADNDVLYIVRDLIYPVDFFDPDTDLVNVNGFNGTPCTAQCAENINRFFDNASADHNDTIAELASDAAAGANANAVLGTPSDLGGGATFAANFTAIAGAGFATGTHSLSAAKAAFVDELLSTMVGARTIECLLLEMEARDFGEWDQIVGVSTTEATYRNPEGGGIEIEVTLQNDGTGRGPVSITCP